MQPGRGAVRSQQVPRITWACSISQNWHLFELRWTAFEFLLSKTTIFHRSCTVPCIPSACKVASLPFHKKSLSWGGRLSNLRRSCACKKDQRSLPAHIPWSRSHKVCHLLKQVQPSYPRSLSQSFQAADFLLHFLIPPKVTANLWAAVFHSYPRFKFRSGQSRMYPVFRRVQLSKAWHWFVLPIRVQFQPWRIGVVFRLFSSRMGFQNLPQMILNSR